MEGFVTAFKPDYKLFWYIFMLLNGSNTSSFQQHVNFYIKNKIDRLMDPLSLKQVMKIMKSINNYPRNLENKGIVY